MGGATFMKTMGMKQTLAKISYKRSRTVCIMGFFDSMQHNHHPEQLTSDPVGVLLNEAVGGQTLRIQGASFSLVGRTSSTLALGTIFSEPCHRNHSRHFWESP